MPASQSEIFVALVAQAKAAGLSASDLMVAMSSSSVPAAPLVATQGPESAVGSGTDLSFSVVEGSQPPSVPGTGSFVVVPETPFSTTEAVHVVPAEAPVFSTVSSIVLDEPASEIGSRASLPKSLRWATFFTELAHIFIYWPTWGKNENINLLGYL